MGEIIISGIQQIGIGVTDVEAAWRWYRKAFKADVPILNEAAEAPFMKTYTGGEIQSRHAVLAANLLGGGGFEIWQYTSRKPQPPPFQPTIGDLGINLARVKSCDVEGAYAGIKSLDAQKLYPLTEDPVGNQQFFLMDPYGNLFAVVRAHDWFMGPDHPTGGVSGALIGVSDIDRSLPFYRNILGYDSLLYDEEGVFSDFKTLPGGDRKVRRALLTHSIPRKGALSNLLGTSTIELVQLMEETPRKLFENRYWGDLGFIHICFDVNGMDQLKQFCADEGFPFTAESGEKFEMGDAGGRFAYIEDPDGTLIEFVETHKIPIIKKIGWYLNLEKRDPAKPLPDFILKALALTRVKD